MKFIYKPEGTEPQSWDFEPNKLMSPEVEAIERHTGLTFMEWVMALEKGSFNAFHGLLYVMLKRSHPTLKWTDVQFCMDDVGWDLDVTDMENMIGVLEAKAKESELTEAEALQLDNLRTQLAEAEATAPLEPSL